LSAAPPHVVASVHILVVTSLIRMGERGKSIAGRGLSFSNRQICYSYMWSLRSINLPRSVLYSQSDTVLHPSLLSVSLLIFSVAVAAVFYFLVSVACLFGAW
jgi:hypothetical protein